MGGKWSDKYIYENYFLIILILMNIPVLLLHICQGGSITFEMGVPIYVDGFEK